MSLVKAANLYLSYGSNFMPIIELVLYSSIRLTCQLEIRVSHTKRLSSVAAINSVAESGIQHNALTSSWTSVNANFAWNMVSGLVILRSRPTDYFD